MSGEPTVSFTGNVTADAELRFLPSGKAVASFTLVFTNRVKKGDSWEDGDPTFVRVSCWERMAENVAESVTKGTRVTVTGRLATRNWETKEGETRSSLEIQAEDVALSLRFATASAQRNTPGGSAPAARPAPADDPWATTAPAAQVDDGLPPF